jgi:iron-sulfur cluster assembly accessory protein
MIVVSERAVTELKKAIADHKTQDPAVEEVYVRVGVVGGGCSGFQNVLSLDEGKTDKDTVFEIEGLNFVVDRMSALYLEGTKLDFVEDLNRMGFKFENPRAVGSCGCGQSFSM